jgi:hypothetical protein
VNGNEAPWIELGWRFPGAASADAAILPLIAGILHNYQAGLFDLNLIQQQKLLEAYAYPRPYEDFSSLLILAKPREGQSLEEVEKLVMEQIENLRNGNFEDWLPEAVLKDLKLSEIKSFEKNQGRSGAITGAFVLGIEWPDFVRRWKKLEKLTKADIVAFAQKYLRPDNYAVIYKRQDEDKAMMKVDKPDITPIEVNREGVSAFAQDFLQKDTQDIEPQFIDFQKVIKKTSVSKIRQNAGCTGKEKQTFPPALLLRHGQNRRPSGWASWPGYLSFLGTSRLSPTEVQQAFYRLGLALFGELPGRSFLPDPQRFGGKL